MGVQGDEGNLLVFLCEEVKMWPLCEAGKSTAVCKGLTGEQCKEKGELRREVSLAFWLADAGNVHRDYT